MIFISHTSANWFIKIDSKAKVMTSSPNLDDWMEKVAKKYIYISLKNHS